jgi:hypothetical protein
MKGYVSCVSEEKNTPAKHNMKGEMKNGKEKLCMV